MASSPYLDRFPPENEEGLGSLRQESREFMDQDGLDFVGLLDLDANAYTVDAWLDEDLLVFVACNDQGGQQNLG